MDEQALSYWQMVWRRFCRQRLALAGLALAIFFFAVALAAPLLCGRLPFYWCDLDGAVSFPWWREFFSPIDTREVFLEKTFNFLLLFLPGLGLWRWVSKKFFFTRVFFRRGAVGIAIVLMLPFIFTAKKNQPADYWQMAQHGDGNGIFPLLPYGPYEQNYFTAKTPPSWRTAKNKAADGAAALRPYSYLGSDEVGRDVLARLIYGSRVSLAVGFISVSLATLIGLFIGAMAGYYGGRVDMLISRGVEIMMCFPTFFLILTVVAFLDQRSIINIMLIIGLTGWTGTAMVMRGEFFKQRSLDYVAAATVLGASTARIVFRHILPNALAPILVGMSFSIAGAIMTESGLSFLGIGVAMPTATWGELLLEGRDSPLANWWLSVFPGVAIFLVMTAYNLIGEGLRDAIDPKTTR